jgi:hypothetical protein
MAIRGEIMATARSTALINHTILAAIRSLRSGHVWPYPLDSLNGKHGLAHVVPTGRIGNPKSLPDGDVVGRRSLCPETQHRTAAIQPRLERLTRPWATKRYPKRNPLGHSREETAGTSHLSAENH